MDSTSIYIYINSKQHNKLKARYSLFDVESIGIIYHIGCSFFLDHIKHGMPMREFPSSITDEIPA